MIWSEVVDGRGGVGSSGLRTILWLMSFGFRFARSVVNWAIDSGVIRRGRVDVPVLSVGNVVAGGTGKTPLIDFLAGQIGGCAVVSRGYRSESVRKNVVVESDMNARVCGDEPLLLRRRGHRVYVGRNRFVSAQMAQRGGASSVLLDDGMQQRWLESDLSVAVVGGKRVFGNGFFLPRGYLRDSPKRLRAVDLVVVNGVDDFAAVERVVGKYSDAPVVGMKPRIVGIFGVYGEKTIKGMRVRVFCAIGNPERFVESVRDAGAQVIDVVKKPDHIAFRVDELKDDDVDLLVCTEKDWVKLERPSKKMAFVKIELAVVKGEKNMRNFLDQVRQLVEKTNGGTK
jgi:tetraacyldisaccharide 4'-kinase